MRYIAEEFLASIGIVAFVVVILFVLPAMFGPQMTDFGLLH